MIVASFSNVSKSFGKTSALKDLNLEVKKGQAVALLGPNGAGKSTALTILQGLRQPTTGTVRIFGQKPGTPDAMARIGVTPQTTDFPPQLSPRELLEFASAHFQRPRNIDQLIETFALNTLIDRRVQGFSGGERRRVALALCFAGNPELVILDEPTSGLDAAGQKDFSIMANQFVADGGALILTSHYWLEIESIANHIVMIDNGITVMDGTVPDIKSAFGLNHISFFSATPGPHIKKNYQLENENWELVTNDSDDAVRTLIKSGEPFSNLKVTPRDLEEAIAIYRQKQTANADQNGAVQ
ncbi:MAG: ABC transporter ATP-binding protein [Devosiaceae bacterium]|nr:ABC transporter ATP-binding protein [Devosiaceae bacterium]